MDLLRLLGIKKKNKKFNIDRERERFYEMKFNQNENNIRVKEKVIKCLEENINEKEIEIKFGMSEIANCKISPKWYYETAKHFIGECEVISLPLNLDFEYTLKIRKL